MPTTQLIAHSLLMSAARTVKLLVSVAPRSKNCTLIKKLTPSIRSLGLHHQPTMNLYKRLVKWVPNTQFNVGCTVTDKGTMALTTITSHSRRSFLARDSITLQTQLEPNKLIQCSILLAQVRFLKQSTGLQHPRSIKFNPAQIPTHQRSARTL